MEWTIGTLVVGSFVVSIVALAALIWAISKSQMGFQQSDAHTIFEAESGRGTDVDDPATAQHQATPAADPEGRVTETAATRWVLLTVFVIATLFMLWGSAFGMIASVKLHLPDWLTGAAPISFGRMRAMHLNLVIYGWLSLGGLGLALWMLPVVFGTHLRLPWLAFTGAGFWTLGTVAGVVGIGHGRTDGLEWLEIPWQADILLTIGGACVALPLVLTVAHRRVRHIYVTAWYYLAAFLWFPIVFTVANIPGLHVGAQQATVNWWFAHNVLGLWLTPIGVGAAYYLIPRIIGEPIYAYSVSLLGFWGLALIYSQVGIHHLIGGPIPTWAVTLSVVQSIMMFIPVIAVAINQHPLWLGNLTVFWASLPLRFVAIGALAYTLASFQGSLQALRSFNTVVHFTHYTVAHAHHGVYAFVTLVLFGALYYIVPRLVGRVWPSLWLMIAHFWCVVIGFAIYFISLTIGGVLQGNAMLDASRPFMDSVEVTIPYLVARSVGGGLMTLGHVLFAINLFLILIGVGHKRQPDQAREGNGQPIAEGAS